MTWLRPGEEITPEVAPHLFVIIGATGDLSRRKLVPALLGAMTNDMAKFAVLGVGRQPVTDEEFRSWTRASLVAVDADELEAWSDERVFFHQADAPDGYLDLARRIKEVESECDLPGNRVIYLALPPWAFPEVIEELGAAGLHRSPGWTRLVIEKPFGRDLGSAHRLNEIVHHHFDESSIYRIDHYLGKETVQNLLAFRFANLLFESAWNRDRIQSVEITVAESVGTEGRSSYYDHAGVLRDMVQNHLSQLLSLVAMEAPRAFEADAIRSAKVDLLRSVSPVRPEAIVYGQYGPGHIDGVDTAGYTDDPDVAADSKTATFVAMRLQINNWRWQGVPFYLRTGKRLPEKTTQIAVTFKTPPVCLFHGVEDTCETHQNVLILILQPDEGFELRFDVKAPGDPLRLQSVPLHFAYAEAFHELPPAYETLIRDVIEGDQTLFVRSDEVEASWALWSPLLDLEVPVRRYPAGSWGPAEVDAELGLAEPWVMSD